MAAPAAMEIVPLGGGEVPRASPMMQSTLTNMRSLNMPSLFKRGAGPSIPLLDHLHVDADSRTNFEGGPRRRSGLSLSDSEADHMLGGGGSKWGRLGKTEAAEKVVLSTKKRRGGAVFGTAERACVNRSEKAAVPEVRDSLLRKLQRVEEISQKHGPHGKWVSVRRVLLEEVGYVDGHGTNTLVCVLTCFCGVFLSRFFPRLERIPLFLLFCVCVDKMKLCPHFGNYVVDSVDGVSGRGRG